MAAEVDLGAEGPSPGRWFRVTLPDGRTGGGQVVAVEPRAVAVRLSAGLWTCAVGQLDLEAEPIAVEHLAVAPARLAAVAWLGTSPVPAAQVALHAGWAGAGATVVDAPLPVVLGALLALA